MNDILQAEVCLSCHTAKDANEFRYKGRPRKYNKPLLHAVCSPCRRSLKYRRDRAAVIMYYGNNDPKCACCGNSYIPCLTLDHVAGGGNIERNKLGDGYWSTLLKRKAEGYQILCMNCNWVKGRTGACRCQGRGNSLPDEIK